MVNKELIVPIRTRNAGRARGGDLRELEGARQALGEGLEFYRRLARSQPQVYEPYVATTLNKLGAVLGELRELEGARQAYSEALEIYRRLARSQPQVYEPYVATTLNKLGAVLGELRELEIRRRVARSQPQVYEPDAEDKSDVPSDMAAFIQRTGVGPSDLGVIGSEIRGPLALESVVTGLRDKVGGLPISILVHGWGMPPAEHFLNALTPFLNEEDAVWLIPAKETQAGTRPPEIRGAVKLDLNRGTDQRTYKNLVGDIVFFAASEDKSVVAQVQEFRQRARAVVVDSQGPRAGDALRAAWDVKLKTYLWSRDAGNKEHVT